MRKLSREIFTEARLLEANLAHDHVERMHRVDRQASDGSIGVVGSSRQDVAK